MLCDYYRGRLSFDEALNMDIPFLHYLWYRATEEIKDKDKQKKREGEKLEDELLEGR
nr:MAG TPA: hypothetical protein [Caudoviricetes sp.]